MLLAKAFKVFRGSWKGLGIVLAGCALVCCVLHFDLLGVADRVPEAFQIQTLEIRIADNTYTLTPEKDADLLEQVRPPEAVVQICCSGDGGPQIFHLV